MSKYGFATLIGDYPDNYEFTPDNIPLHLTHVDSFEIDLDDGQLEDALRQAIGDQPAFRVRALSDMFYGPNKDIPVTVLELTPELHRLHVSIMGMLGKYGAVLKNPQFHGDTYQPHVSIYSQRRVRIGERVAINKVSFGTKTGEGAEAVHHIVATVSLNH